ncbi:serine/threonine-protein phosphatase 6 regulatory subunit 2-like isoform X2 [Sycon ciliatum]|uniref:serine/threonine-protein phosphatase 6 regulatory subunit 2-like isoform X2 n=1 Tax=Sycon ciliatum TaxID=27933 RepID=UPI0031F6BE99
MFWKMRMQAPSALDDLLASDSCTLEEVLDEENVVDELRSNRALLDFLTRGDILSEIITLVIEEPPDDLEESVRYKHPHVACNLFSLEQSSANALADSIVADESLLDKLWTFLDQDAPLNPLLASFFSRVLLSLLQRKAVVMMEYMSSRDGALRQLLGHIDTSAIMDLILGMVSACDSAPLRRDLVQWFRDAQLVRSLVDLVHPSVDEDKQRNAARALSELVRMCYDHLGRTSDVLQSDPLLDILEHDDTIQRLLNNILTESAETASPTIRGVHVLQSMLTLQQGLTDQSQVVASLTPWLSAFHRLLLEPPTSRPVVTTVGTIAVPVGPARLGIIQLLLLCLQSNVPEFMEEFIRLNIGPTLLDLFFQYMWNNFLHTQVEQLVVFAFTNKTATAGASSSSGTTSMSTMDSTGSQAEKANSIGLGLLSSYQLTEKLAQAGIDNDREQGAPGGRRRGYMGHIVSMCNTITSTMESDERVAAAVKDVCDEQENCLWKEWVDGGLATANERNNALLGGQQMMDDDPDEILMEPSSSTTDSIHQAFLNYQSEQLSTEFADSFGFDEEELGFAEPSVSAPYDEAAALDFDLVTAVQTSEEDQFKTCCEARIEQFGNIPSWDDNWSAVKTSASSSAMDEDLSNSNDDRQAGEAGASSSSPHTENSDETEAVSSHRQSPHTHVIEIKETPKVTDLDDSILMDDTGDNDDEGESIDEDAAGNFDFLTAGLMSKKSVEVSDIRADAEAAMKEFEEVTGMASS